MINSEIEAHPQLSHRFNENSDRESYDQETECNDSRRMFQLASLTARALAINGISQNERHIMAAIVINAYVKGYLVRRMMKTQCVIALKNTYKEASHCTLRLHIDAPLELPEVNFHHRLQCQCDAASMNIVELFSQAPAKKKEIIFNDRQIRKAKTQRPISAISSISFATQRTLARKKLKQMEIYELLDTTKASKSRCSAGEEHIFFDKLFFISEKNEKCPRDFS